MKHSKRPLKDAEIAAKIKNCLENRRYKQSLHAMERIDKRKVSFQDVLFVLETGHREEAKDSYDETFQNWKYSIKGKTLENVNIRVIITLNEENIIVITVVNLTIKDSV
ncbi:MAG: DUF4258 domain-containing protein [Verrucomicrobia bacterium]|nr:DUF4258 domain-containing protein [Verrucomicrobiota bacterium]MBS0646543.1 DUF4258 domain-containing protein [Verrucomicrobiota bacterium]